MKSSTKQRILDAVTVPVSVAMVFAYANRENDIWSWVCFTLVGWVGWNALGGLLAWGRDALFAYIDQKKYPEEEAYEPGIEDR